MYRVRQVLTDLQMTYTRELIFLSGVTGAGRQPSFTNITRKGPDTTPKVKPWMKEVRDNTSRRGGLPTLPGLNLSTF